MTPEITSEFYYVSGLNQYDDTDVVLKQGIDCCLDDIHFECGLLSFKGRQVVLYLKDHGDNVLSAIEDPNSHGRKFHLTDCQTVKGMLKNDREERYIVTNKTSGDFLISGRHFSDGREIEEKARLKVCKYCLAQLHYKGYSVDKTEGLTQIYTDFCLNTFFSAYCSFFSYHLESEQSDRHEYTGDWRKIASRYKAKINYSCSQCALNMRAYKEHFYTHHINGIKSDNAETNLKALCVECYKKQPEHADLIISHEIRQLLSISRRKQGLITSDMGWDHCFEYADPALHGVLYRARNLEISVPEIGFVIKNTQKEVLAWVDLAWPQHKFAVAISLHIFELAKEEGWEIITMRQFLNEPEQKKKWFT